MSVIFSVVVPVYNAEKYLSECVASVMGQDFQSYELILVDDGSRDSSPRLCDELARQYPNRIRVIHQKNAGQFAARVSGFEQASGDYIVNADADDMLEANALSCLHHIYSKQRVDMVVYRLSSVDSNGVILDSPKALFSRGPVSKEELLQRMISTGKINSMVLKSFVRKAYNLDLSHRLSHGVDYYMSLMVLDDIETVWYEPTPLYRYRFNAASATNNKDVHSYRDYLYLADYTLDYITVRKLGNDLAEAYLKRFTKNISVALMNTCIGKTDEKRSILTKLRQDKTVLRCEQYVSSSKLRDRIPLRLFYHERYGALILHERVYHWLETRAVAAKRVFAR